MLERIYIDNYKCLVNFEYRPGALQLLLGGNGSGKSTVFEVLGLLRAFIVDGEETADLFGVRTLTRWQTRKIQTFELEVAGNGGTYVYKLAVEHLDEHVLPFETWVSREELLFGGNPLFSSGGGEAQLYRDGHLVEETGFLDPQRSALSMLTLRRDDAELTWFRNWMSALYRIQINPYSMSPDSGREQLHPASDFSNYASWYRHISQEKPKVARSLLDYLKPIISGLEDLSLSKEGKLRVFSRPRYEENQRNL